MSEVYRIIAARQAEQYLRRMAAYVREHNARLSEDEVLAVVYAGQQYSPHSHGMPGNPAPKGFFTERAKELAQVLVDPDKRQDWLDKRERHRNAPIDRALRERRRQQQLDQMRKDLGKQRIPERAQTPDERAADMARQVMDRIKRQPASPPAHPAHGRDDGSDAFGSSTPDVPSHTPDLEDDDEDEGSFDHSQEVIRRLRQMDSRPRGES